VSIAPGRLSQGHDYVQSPHGERPCDKYGLESVSLEVGLTCVELAPFAGAYDLVGVGDRCGPVEALAERVAHESAWCRVMSAHACVDVTDEILAMGNGDAPLQDAGCSVLIQLTGNHGE
jgi:hypothetical protein